MPVPKATAHAAVWARLANSLDGDPQGRERFVLAIRYGCRIAKCERRFRPMPDFYWSARRMLGPVRRNLVHSSTRATSARG